MVIVKVELKKSVFRGCVVITVSVWILTLMAAHRLFGLFPFKDFSSPFLPPTIKIIKINIT